jgi:hypothetical protein
VVSHPRPGGGWRSSGDHEQLCRRAHQNVHLHDRLVGRRRENLVGAASAYTEILALDDMRALVIYDRIPHGWKAIPKDSADTNSMWVMRLTLTGKR